MLCVNVRIKGYAGWIGVSFLFFFNKKFLYLLWVLLVGLRGLVWGFGVGCGGLFGGEVEGVACQMHPFWVWIAWSVLGADAFGWLRSFHGLLSGQIAMSGAWPWIGFDGPGEGLRASLIISLMLCNYIKFQNCR